MENDQATANAPFRNSWFTQRIETRERGSGMIHADSPRRSFTFLYNMIYWLEDCMTALAVCQEREDAAYESGKRGWNTFKSLSIFVLFSTLVFFFDIREIRGFRVDVI